ncbi:nucleoside triphosphate pyrophosphohydrolase [Alphaproteobacteria bacterium]|nr:nucleoside triphosphate pyrophosphohydrolase [Alphaproteobacteria bacterium]
MRSIDRLLSIMARLRDPETGCPWDAQQDFGAIAPYTLEEAYEVVEAIETDDMDSLKDELGDLLLQVVFHSRMAEERNLFSFEDVASAIADKMVRRHPHVFADAAFDNQEQQAAAWEAEKAKERAVKIGPSRNVGILGGVSVALPAATRAAKLQARAARAGFDWPDAAQILDKVAEEAQEVRDELEKNGSHERIEDEIGDLLFACINLARKLSVDPESAIRRCNRKFERRFRFIESELKRNRKSVHTVGLPEMEALWNAAKRLEEEGSKGEFSSAS